MSEKDTDIKTKAIMAIAEYLKVDILVNFDDQDIPRDKLFNEKTIALDQKGECEVTIKTK